MTNEVALSAALKKTNELLKAKVNYLETALQEFENRRDIELKELARAYTMVKDVENKYIETTSQLNAANQALGPAQFWERHYDTLKAENRLIELDFPVTPKSRNWLSSPNIKKLIEIFNKSENKYVEFMTGFLKYAEMLRRIPVDRYSGLSVCSPHWRNGWIPGLDGIVLYSLVSDKNPAIYFEVGSGNSTKFVRQAIKDYSLRTKIVSVDPYPREEIDDLCDEIYRTKFEDLDLSILQILSPEDVVFIDNSHRSFSNSDVTVFFMDVLGRLPPGIIYGLHDIFLPYDYPEGWMPRYYNEQYILAAYLFGGAGGDDIILPCGYITRTPHLISTLDPIWNGHELRGIMPEGGGFWMRKGAL